jgi:TetR/AcrR family transcriptional regulator
LSEPQRVDGAGPADARERILEAACHEFSLRGFGATTMRQIASQAGVAHPLLHYHFGEKERLWRAAAERLYGRVLDMLDDSVLAIDAFDDEARIRHILTEIVLIASETRVLTFLVEASDEDSGRARWLWEHWVKPAQERILAVIVEGQDLGLIVKTSPELVYQLLSGFSLADSAGQLLTGTEASRSNLRARVAELVSFLMSGGKLQTKKTT